MQRRYNPTLLFLSSLFIAALVYSLFFSRRFVGAANDDAMYIVAALSLLQGRFAAIEVPGTPPLNVPLPGYPLFLAPFAAAVQPHWALLKLTSLALILLTAFLAWRFWDGWPEISPALKLFATVLFLFNPVTVLASTEVMSEPLFLFLVLLIFFSLQYLLADDQPVWKPVLLGLITGWASLVRPQGFILIPSLLIGLAYGRRWRLAAPLLGTASAVWGAVMLRNYVLTHSVNAYFSRWNINAPFLSLLALLTNAADVLQTLFITALLALFPWSDSPGSIGLKVILCLAVFALIIVGVIRLSRRSGQDRIVLTALASFCFLYVLGYALWVAVSPHYFLPVIPFLLVFTAVGGASFLSRPQRRAAAWIFCGLWLAVYTVQIQRTWVRQQQDRESPRNRLPAETLRWVQSSLPPAALIFSDKSKFIYLYTGRHIRYLQHVRDLEAFHYALLKGGVTHVVLWSEMYLSPEAGLWWDHFDQWLTSSHGSFKKVYENSQDVTTVYQVVPQEGYTQAWELYLSAQADLASGALNPARTKLARALTLYPRLTNALNAYGATCYLLNRDLPEAEQRLQEAVRLRPDFQLAWMNLSRVEGKLGRHDLERSYAEKAEALERSARGARAGMNPFSLGNAGR